MAKAYSYARYSTKMQSAEQGGESLSRQMALARAWCASQNPPITLDEVLTDEMSGSKGGHIGPGAALGDFLARVHLGEIEAGSFLIIENFSRLSRLPIDLANGIIVDLIRADIRIVTLQTYRVYDRASLRANQGELGSIITLLEAAHNEAATRSKWGKYSWGEGGRRHRLTYMTPAWIRPSNDRIEIDGRLKFPPNTEFVKIPECVAVIETIFHLYVSGHGVDRIVRLLNDRKGKYYAPAFSRSVKPGTKTIRRESSDRGWHHSYVRSLLFTRRVLGEIDAAESEYTDEGKVRPKPLHVRYKLYPAAISETLWQDVQDAKRPGIAGRKGEGFSNLFGGIAKCGCGANMRMVSKGADNSYRYLTCVDAHRSKDCEHRKLYRYEPFEQGMLKMLGVLAFGDMPQTEDGTAHIRGQIALVRSEAAEIQIRFNRESYAIGEGKDSPLWQHRAAELRAEHSAKLTRIKALEAEMVTMRTARPLSEQLGEVDHLVRSMGSLPAKDRYAVRAKINMGMAGILKAIQFNQDGQIILRFQRSELDLPYAPDWHFWGVTNDGAMIARSFEGKLVAAKFNAPVTQKQYEAQVARSNEMLFPEGTKAFFKRKPRQR